MPLCNDRWSSATVSVSAASTTRTLSPIQSQCVSLATTRVQLAMEARVPAASLARRTAISQTTLALAVTVTTKACRSAMPATHSVAHASELPQTAPAASEDFL